MKLDKKATPLGKDKVLPHEKTKVIWADSPFHKRGSVSEVHPVQAEKLIASGKAIAEGQELPALKTVVTAPVIEPPVETEADASVKGGKVDTGAKDLKL